MSLSPANFVWGIKTHSCAGEGRWTERANGREKGMEAVRRESREEESGIGLKREDP
jgi:hypothetical protein